MKHMKDFSPVLVSYDNLKRMGILYSREHLRRLEAAGDFPKRLRLSPSRVAWKLCDIEEWIETRPVGTATV